MAFSKKNSLTKEKIAKPKALLHLLLSIAVHNVSWTERYHSKLQTQNLASFYFEKPKTIFSPGLIACSISMLMQKKPE